MKYSKYFWTDKYLTNHVHHIYVHKSICKRKLIQWNLKNIKPKSQSSFTTRQYLFFAEGGGAWFMARHLRRLQKGKSRGGLGIFVRCSQ